MRFLKNIQNLVIILLGILFFIRIPQEDIRFIFWVLGGVSLCFILDFFINNFFLKKKIFPKSAIITGFILSGILDYRQAWFVLLIFSSLAILSKYIVKFKKAHIFNPANLALFIATLFRIPLVWNIESNIYLIIIFGIYIVYSLKKIPQVMGFLIFFAALFMASGMNPFGHISWFFVFVMLIEPKTSEFGKIKGFIFGSIAGITSFLVFKFIPKYDFFVASLFIANLSHLIWKRPKVG